jgi:short-chain Z-isoprenyl diphosphate synthase
MLSGWLELWTRWLANIRRKIGARALRPLYELYEAKLVRRIRQRPVPRHVGVILDGNRRYALRQGLAESREAYEIGARKLDEVITWCVELGVPALTLWAFSTDNFSRPQEQVEGILAAIEIKLRELASNPRIHAHGIRVKAIGRIEQLPQSLQASIRLAEEATSNYDDMSLSLAIAYGGREEITDAVRAVLLEAAHDEKTLVEAAELVSPDNIARHLYLAGAPDPDLIIRTSGEIRLSGFLLWQSAASEFYFSDVLWPDFRRVDFLRAVRSFQGRNRRFGR